MTKSPNQFTSSQSSKSRGFITLIPGGTTLRDLIYEIVYKKHNLIILIALVFFLYPLLGFLRKLLFPVICFFAWIYIFYLSLHFKNIES